MAELIKELDKLSIHEQEKILEQMSESFIPIEIDSLVYMIPEEVSFLIDSLTSQLEQCQDAISKN